MRTVEFGALIEECQSYREALLPWISDNATSEHVLQHWYHRVVEEGYPPSASGSTHDRLSRGAILFLTLFKCVTSAESEVSGLVDAITSDPDFLLAVHVVYGIPASHQISDLKFHASGTTSLIFRAATVGYGNCALKLIQPPYMGIPQVQEATESYKERYGTHTRYSPQIFISTPLYILMEFIDGEPLNAFIDRLRAENPAPNETYIDAIAKVFSGITVALSYYEELNPPRIHGDLSPYNIMVVASEDGGPQIRLIDFGPNYILQDRIVNRRTLFEVLERLQVFSAPELARSEDLPTLKTDVYSLGMIGLDLMSREPLTMDTLGARLKQIWQQPGTSGFAQVIEDMIDRDPQYRLLMLGNPAGGVFRAIKDVAAEKVFLYKELIVKPNAEMSLWANLKKKFIPDILSSLRNIWTIVSTNESGYSPIGKGALLASALNVLCGGTIVFAFLLWTLVDAQQKWFPSFQGFGMGGFVYVVKALPHNFVIGDFWTNLPGRCVAVTFGLVASRYYANIFAPLSVKDMGGLLQAAANACMRLNSVSYFIPIMIAIVWNPKLWPYCTFAGALFPAINNLFCYWVASRAAANSRQLFESESKYDSESFLLYYREWWLLMGSYTVGIGVIGLLLQYGYAQDEPIYATFVCLMNMAKIYRNNCGIEAPDVQGNLARLLFFQRRSAAAKLFAA